MDESTEPARLLRIIAALSAERDRIESGEIVHLEINSYHDHIKIKYVGYKTITLT